MSSNGNKRDTRSSGLALSIDRRNFLRLGATVSAGLFLPEVLGCGSDPVSPGTVTPPNPEIQKPAWVRSKDGVLDIEITITETDVTVGAYTFKTRAYTGLTVNKGTASFTGTYTGKLPGPTLEVSPGDTIIMKLMNKLPSDNLNVDPTDCGIANASGSSTTGGDSHHVPGFSNNTTNMHVHGLHVDPGPPGDDVLLEIAPGESYDFVFKIPKDLPMPDGTVANHPAGTYWYHPHVHRSTAIQVMGGMAGAILIRDPANDDLDALFAPEPQAGQGKEQLLVIGEFMLQTLDTCPGAPRLATYNEIVTDADGTTDFFTVNGQVNPIIRMRPSEVQRYRLIHAGFHLPLDVAFVRVPDDQVDSATKLPKAGYTPFSYACPANKHFDSEQDPGFLAAQNALRAQSVPYVQVATDGVTYPKPISMPMADAVSEVEYLIGPGNRVDILAQFQKGTYQMVTLGYDLGFACSEPQVLGTIIVDGEPDTSIEIPATMKTPALYPGFDDTMKPGNMVSKKRSLEFKVVVDKGATGTSGYHFTIDGKEFCEGRVDQCMATGATEEWTVNNVQKGASLHPFHIHVNSFLVTSLNGKPPAYPIWRDTLLLPRDGYDMDGLGGTFTFLSRFLHFEGAYVLHCHMLQHEDLGMMQLIDVEKDGICTPPSNMTCP
ncbi:multicopper oxidase family protein [Sorangium sp. So ce1099]|uniref:multicopper oxidase family protein n=1 Tax=Sorangium sp. So ce1099 TaxID=3133331 RepID=UPI003F6127A8